VLSRMCEAVEMRRFAVGRDEQLRGGMAGCRSDPLELQRGQAVPGSHSGIGVHDAGVRPRQAMVNKKASGSDLLQGLTARQVR
jgi:hypothetical protein